MFPSTWPGGGPPSVTGSIGPGLAHQERPGPYNGGPTINFLDAKGVIDVSWTMPTRPITVAETQLFIRQADDVWSDDERFEFVDFIASNPGAGDVIPETGGVRKIRWGRQGSGKRGGVRVIYFYYDDHAPLYFLMLYAKGEKEDLRPEEKRAVALLAATLKALYRSGRT